MSSTQPQCPRLGRLTAVDRVLLLVLTLAILLPGTCGVSLTDRDEGWYAQVSREMLATGDWLIPHYLGQPWIAKPPLLYWCVAAVWSVTGVHVWAARLITVLATAGVVQLLATLAGDMYGRRAALIAAISFITAGLPVITGKMLLTDGVLLLCCMGAIVFLWRAATRGPTWSRAVGFWLCVGLAILAKGPAVIVFVGAFALGLLTRRQWRGWLRSGRFWLASPLALLVAAPWYTYAALHAGGTLWQQFFGYEILDRLGGTPHGHGGPPGYYVVLSLAGWMPWTVLVPGAAFEAWHTRKTDQTAWLLLIWFALPWVFLELIASKLPHYILPCYVPLAIMFGRMWDVGVGRPGTRGQRFVLGLWTAVPIVVGALLIVLAVAGREFAWSLAAGVSGAALLLGFVVVAVLVRRRSLLPAWVGAFGVAGVFYILLGSWVLPGFEPYRLSRRIAEEANKLSTPADEVLVSGYTEPSLFFYLDRPARIVGPPAIAAALADSRTPHVIIAGGPDLSEIGIETEPAPPGWQRVEGANYVKARHEILWVQRSGDAAGDRPPVGR